MDELSLSPVHNDADELTHYIGINRDVMEKLEAETRLRQSQKMEAIGQLSVGIAHDFNNLLNIITGNLEFLSHEMNAEERQEHITEATHAIQMGARLTQRLLSFARQGTLEPTDIDLNEQVLKAVELLRSTIGESISISTTMCPELWRTRIDPSEIENTVVNLVINARDAMPNGGRIFIETANVSHTADDAEVEPGLAPGDYVRLSVSDNGSGMTPEVKARIFEPFYTTKSAGKGTGLGLSSIYCFAKQSGGHVTVYSEIEYGTIVHVYLPKCDMTNDSVTEKAHILDALEPKTKGGCVLVVEDNKQVLKITSRRLAALGYAVLQAENGIEAIDILRSDSAIDLVFTDMELAGGLSGYDVAQWVQDNRPTCKLLLTSGFNEQNADDMDRRIVDLKLLQKPYELADLHSALHSVLGAE